MILAKRSSLDFLSNDPRIPREGESSLYRGIPFTANLRSPQSLDFQVQITSMIRIRRPVAGRLIHKRPFPLLTFCSSFAGDSAYRVRIAVAREKRTLSGLSSFIEKRATRITA